MAGTIAELRDLVPIRPLSLGESLRVAELQATRLLSLSGIKEPPVPETIISELPRIQVERIHPSPVSGAAHWAQGRWILVVNGIEPRTRQRFSIGHEFKHVLDNPFVKLLYPPLPGVSSEARAEQVCDFFAACLLMPRRWLKKAWTTGSQDVRSLARRFEVSQAAMQVRLVSVGLIESGRHWRPTPSSGGRSRRSTTGLLALLVAQPALDPAFWERLPNP